MLEHGGRLLAAARRYGRAPAQWLDLSTGLNPQAWDAWPDLASAWRRLPEDDDGLHEAAQHCYGTAALLPVAGSQAALQTLPGLRAPSRVAVLAPSYNEHAYRWQRAGHRVEPMSAAQIRAAAARCDVLVVCNPNNPDGTRFEAATLLDCHAQLAARGGWLVVDEAFIDADARHSLVAHAATRAGLVVLRSFGKFFGLAGARVGFAFAEARLLATLADALGPWPIAAPSRVVAAAALRDRGWQENARARLAEQSARLATRLAAHGWPAHGGCALFQWVATPQATVLHEALAQRGVLTRRYAGDTTTPAGLRIGLPAAGQWSRFDDAFGTASAALRRAVA